MRLHLFITNISVNGNRKLRLIDRTSLIIVNVIHYIMFFRITTSMRREIVFLNRTEVTFRSKINFFTTFFCPASRAIAIPARIQNTLVKFFVILPLSFIRSNTRIK